MLSIPIIITVTRSAFQDIKNFDSNLLRIDKKSYKNVDIYYIGYITMKDFDYVNIHSVNTLYLIIDKEYIKEKMEINT